MSRVFDHLDQIGEALQPSPFGLITDVDGTISPTAPTPQAAVVSPLCRRYLSRLTRQLSLVAALSGRPVIQVRDMLNIEGMVYIGNHGMERWRQGNREIPSAIQPYSSVIRAVIRELAPLLSIEGLWIEDKEISATIHYRQCPQPESAKRDVLAALENSTRAEGLRIRYGKRAVDLLPPVRLDKGTAVTGLIQEYHLQAGIYLGDDVTDIDAFRAIHDAVRRSNFQGFAIGVITPETPEKLTAEVDFTLNGVAEVERFLQWLAQTAPQPG